MAYNFNPRQNKIRQYRVDDYLKAGFMRKQSVPYGKIQPSKKYDHLCSQQQISYNECLIKSNFDRVTCRENQNNLIKCEYDKDLYQWKQKILVLKNGLQQAKLRKKQANKK